MSVHLSPATALGFNRPFKDTVRRTLTVKNTNQDPIAFKVKTTAPKAYSVRPNSGRIEPDESVEVQVMLQAIKEEPPLSFKCKDKFLVQSMTITPEMRDTSLNDMWSFADQDPSKHQVHQQRIKVVFLPPEGMRLDEGEEAFDSTFLSVNDSHRYDTVRQPLVSNGNPPAHHFPEPINVVPAPAHPGDTLDRGASPVPDFHAAPEHPQIDEILVQPPPVSPSPGAAIPVTAPGRQETREDNDLIFKYTEAQNEIARLRTLLASVPEPISELRRRRPDEEKSITPTTIDEDDDSDGARAMMGTENGVPPQMVASIALLIFVLTYLFF